MQQNPTSTTDRRSYIEIGLTTGFTYINEQFVAQSILNPDISLAKFNLCNISNVSFEEIIQPTDDTFSSFRKVT